MRRSNRLDPLVLDRDGKASSTKNGVRASPLDLVERAFVLLKSPLFTSPCTFFPPVFRWLSYCGKANRCVLSYESCTGCIS